MIKRISIFIILIASLINVDAQVLVNGQDSNNPLQTVLTDEILSPYNKLFSKKEFNMDQMLAYRAFLKPYAMKGDPIGMLMYAKTHDLYPFKKGSKKDAMVALQYFEKASDMGLADASYVLYGHYRNGYMTLPVNSHKSLEYMHRAIKQGNNSTKAALLGGLARLYHSEDGEVGMNEKFPAINYSLDSTKHNLMLAIKYNPNNNWAKTYLAEIENPKATK